MSLAARRSVMWGLLAALLAGGLAYAFWPQPVPVDLARVSRGALIVTVDQEGRTRVKEVYVVSAPVAGRMLRIDAEVGDPVIAGETVLTTIEPTQPAFLDLRSRARAEAVARTAEAALVQAEAELKRARAELEFARVDYKRAKELSARRTISKRALDLAELAVKTREADLAAAEAAVRIRRHELETARAALITPGQAASSGQAPSPGGAASSGGAGSSCCVEVRAPVSGRILRILHKSESVVPAAEPLVEIGDPRDLEVVVDLLSTDAVGIKKGAEVLIEDWGGGPTLAGRVRRIEPYGFTKVSALGIEEQRVNVIIDFTDPPSKWRRLGHGYRVETRIIVWKGANVLKTPLGALFRRGDAWAAFVEENGRARLRPVEVGRTNGREAQVLDGLREGERVILHPSDRVKNGVRIVARSPG